MMIKILSHAIGMVTRNFGAALKVSLLPYLVYIGVGALLNASIWGTYSPSEADIERILMTEGQGRFWLFLAGVSIVSLFTLSWALVNWHRFVLLEERPSGWIPPLHAEQMKAYAIKAILMAALLVLIIFVMGLLLGFLMTVVPSIEFFLARSFGIVGLFVIGVLISGLYYWITLRYSLALPAAAIGDKSYGLFASWRETASYFKPLYGLSFLAVLMYSLPNLLIQIGVMQTGGQIFVFTLIFGYVSLILGASVLTTLYGVIVEKCELG